MVLFYVSERENYIIRESDSDADRDAECSSQKRSVEKN